MAAKSSMSTEHEIPKEKGLRASENDEYSEEIITEQEKTCNGTFHHVIISHNVKDLPNVFHLNEYKSLPSIFTKLHTESEEYYEKISKPLEFLENVVDALEGVVKINYKTQVECESSLKKFVGHSKGDECKECESNDRQETLLEEDRANKAKANEVVINNIRPAYPWDEEEDDEEDEGKHDEEDEEEDDEENLRIITKGFFNILIPDFPLDLEEVEDVNLHSLNLDDKVASSSDQESGLNDEKTVNSFLKVELPNGVGVWEFLGRGRDNEEALEQAARLALKLLRIMSIPEKD